MTQQRRRRGRGFAMGRGTRRSTEWFDTILNTALAVFSQLVTNLSNSHGAGQRANATLVRTLIDLEVTLQAAGTGLVLHSGIYLAESDSIAAGAVSDPDDTDEEPGWVWRNVAPVFTSVTSDRAQTTRLQFDIKARRRFPGEDYSLILVMNTSAGSGSVNIDGLVRTLIMHRP